jgi:hypothetical protein
MNLDAVRKRLETLEKEAAKRREPSKEKLLFNYFKSMESYFKGEGPEETVLENYSKVCRQARVGA